MLEKKEEYGGGEGVILQLLERIRCHHACARACIHGWLDLFYLLGLLRLVRLFFPLLSCSSTLRLEIDQSCLTQAELLTERRETAVGAKKKSRSNRYSTGGASAAGPPADDDQHNETAQPDDRRNRRGATAAASTTLATTAGSSSHGSSSDGENDNGGDCDGDDGDEDDFAYDTPFEPPESQPLVKSFLYFLEAELYRGYRLEQDAKVHQKNSKQVFQFVMIPLELEKFFIYGFMVCLDCFLSIFTFLPTRVLLALVRLPYVYVYMITAIFRLWRE